MHEEIERKFLVKNNTYRSHGKPIHIHQGFLSTDKERVVRIRIQDDKAFITIKGKTEKATRSEFEYVIPLEDAQFMLENLCEKPTIEKYRYIIPYAGFTWEVDEFHGENAGLVIAEIELQHENQEFQKPEWLGEEVTTDQRYYNANLVKHPYISWKT
jgi:adenylate cyclase